MKNFILYLIVIVILLVEVGPVAVAANKQLAFEDEQIKLRLFPRTPNQMAGFYEARGFPKKMVEVLTRFCIMTVVVHNKTKDVLWLDLDRWKFVSDSGELKRIRRNEWPPRWEKMQIPMASQSTFRWTLLPEALKFFPDEHEGGNIIFVSMKNSFSLQASFAVGENKDKGFVMALVNSIQCAKDGDEAVEKVSKQ